MVTWQLWASGVVHDGGRTSKEGARRAGRWRAGHERIDGGVGSSGKGDNGRGSVEGEVRESMTWTVTEEHGLVAQRKWPGADGAELWPPILKGEGPKDGAAAGPSPQRGSYLLLLSAATRRKADVRVIKNGDYEVVIYVLEIPPKVCLSASTPPIFAVERSPMVMQTLGRVDRDAKNKEKGTV